MPDTFAPAVGAPDRIGQGTAIEQARAATEVQAMFLIARQFPRERKLATARMLDACSVPELADKAFYAFPRGDDTISGMTIDAVAELAQAWGNIDYGLIELRRDDVYGQSEMLAYALDLENNVRHASTFIVQHVRETKRGNYKVTSPRDIYEVNANMGNRRMRAAVLKVLPRWYKIQAEAALRATLDRMVGADKKPLEEQIEETLALFVREFGVGRDQIEQKARKKIERWTAGDLNELKILGGSLAHKDLTIEEAFPAAKVTVDELAGPAETPAPEVPEQGAEPKSTSEHVGHPEGEWMDGCPGCIAESVAADQEAPDDDA